MIEHKNKKPIFVCDTCGDPHESHHEDFAERWNHARNDGWIAKRIGRDWIHTCGGCQK